MITKITITIIKLILIIILFNFSIIIVKNNSIKTFIFKMVKVFLTYKIYFDSRF